MKKMLQSVFFAMLLLWIVPGVVLSFYGDEEGAGLEPASSSAADLVTEALNPEGICVIVDGEPMMLQWEEYLTGVLLCELPGSFHEEAKKAQAVVARTYAMKLAELGYKHGKGVICDNPNCCQGYLSEEKYLEKYPGSLAAEEARKAVSDTDGIVVTYNDGLIDATYFSCSGGRTEDAVAVWGTDVPYLQTVLSPGEEKTAAFTDTVRFSGSEFEKLLGTDFPGTPDSWFGAAKYTNGGGVETLEICGKKYPGTELRMTLGLRSTAFTVTAIGDSILITTKGFGHRVGMSQYGAQAMAESGCGFEQILKHYYQGVELSHR